MNYYKANDPKASGSVLAPPPELPKVKAEGVHCGNSSATKGAL